MFVGRIIRGPVIHIEMIITPVKRRFLIVVMNRLSIATVQEDGKVNPFITEMIRQSSAKVRHIRSNDHAVLLIDRAVPVLIPHFNLSGILSIGIRFIRFILLPDANLFIVVPNGQRLADKPLVTHIVALITVKVNNLLPVGKQREISAPAESVPAGIQNILTAQGEFNSTVFGFPYIFKYTFEPGRNRKVSFEEHIGRIGLINFNTAHYP